MGAAGHTALHSVPNWTCWQVAVAAGASVTAGNGLTVVVNVIGYRPLD